MESVLNAMNSRTMRILAGWEHPDRINGGATEVGATVNRYHVAGFATRLLGWWAPKIAECQR
jgi:hypothetical protein